MALPMKGCGHSVILRMSGQYFAPPIGSFTRQSTVDLPMLYLPKRELMIL